MVLSELPGGIPMFDNDTQLMVSIFQKVFQLEGSEESDPVKYVEKQKRQIEIPSQLFGYLGWLNQIRKVPWVGNRRTFCSKLLPRERCVDQS
jgi:hypothetical protein